jgi:hypothetical protein
MYSISQEEFFSKPELKIENNFAKNTFCQLGNFFAQPPVPIR